MLGNVKKYLHLDELDPSLKEGKLNTNQRKNKNNHEYKMNTIRILLGILCIGYVLVVYFLIRMNNEDYYLKRLQYIPLAQFMDLIVLHGIFILRNEKMYNFFKHQIKSHLPCFSSIQLLDNGSFAIHALGHAILHSINAPYALGHAALPPINAPNMVAGNQNFGYNTADDSIHVIQDFEPAEVLTIHPGKDCNEEMTIRDKTSSRRHSI